MPSDRAPDSLVSAWQEQPTSGFRPVPADFAKKIRRDVRASRWGFWIFLALFAVMAIWAGANLLAEADPLRRVGHVLAILSVVFFIGQILVLRRRVRAVRFDILRTTSPSLAAARAYLVTRRAFHRGRWLWWRIIVIFPVVPILGYGTLRNEPDAIPRFLWGVMVPWVALIVFAVSIVQRGAARAYERLLRELDDIERHSPIERFMASHEQWKERQGD
ncbi:MAG: hypothetical protein A3H96_13020 [Acidobacteria bacterium RIFCSPLOWO2_02_FULL_67_36]|nr:MAG: hypothetical protein A3H96_13020 [Acidobacteria bacterium RIFCSPLOWO2_02_FULL_67_36]OFW23543.1 MAG: hypothetical protein A3G21_06330 [Acidobacteria bacterium RIFCSPLOWO2_12_FULL_66_21]